MTKLRVLDLFSGIGGFSLGLERTGGFETVAFCEIEEYPRAVLARHWPGVPIYDDVRELTADTLARDGIAVDVICGGFPCQDLSFAGRRAGLEGERSGLWGEYARLIGELRPRFVIIENVPGLLSGGDDIELPPDRCVCGWSSRWGGLHHDLPQEQPGALCTSGHRDECQGAAGAQEDAGDIRRHDLLDAQGDGQVGRGARMAIVRASSGGVSSVRSAVPASEEEAGRAGVEPAADDRWTAAEAEWIGFVDGSGGEGCAHDPRASDGGEPQGTIGDGRGWMVCEACGRDMDNTTSRFVHASWFGRIQRDLAALGYDATWDCIPAAAVGAPHRRDRVWIVAHANTAPVQRRSIQWHEPDGDVSRNGAMADAEQPRLERHNRPQLAAGGVPRLAVDLRAGRACFESSQWGFEPDVGRVVDGVPARVDRLRSLGNAVVPQIPEMIGRAILQAEGVTR